MQMAFKYCIFVFILTCPFLINGKVEFPPEFQQLVQKIHTECAQERKLSSENIKSFDISKKDPAMMCYLKCLFIHSQWMDENEVIQYDFIRKNIPDGLKQITLPNLDTCGKQAVGKNCEKSYQFFMCMHKAFPEDWIIY